MAKQSRIGLRQVRALGPGETIWDASLSGFGARRQKSNAVSYVLFYRTREGRQRWFTIGKHGAPWTPEAARQEAKRLLALLWQITHAAVRCRATFDSADIAEDLVE